MTIRVSQVEEPLAPLGVARRPTKDNSHRHSHQPFVCWGRPDIPTDDNTALDHACFAGGLLSYGNSVDVGIYAGRILKGDKPADMPIDRARSATRCLRFTPC